MKTSHHADKGIAALLAVTVSFIFFLVFIKNQNFLVETDMARTYLLLSGIGISLVLVLMYLVSQRKMPKARTSRPTKRRKK